MCPFVCPHHRATNVVSHPFAICPSNTTCLPPKISHKLCFSFVLGITAIPREIENNAYAKFGGGGGVVQTRCILGYVQVVNGAVNWQLPTKGIHWPVSQDHIGGSGVDPSKFSAAKITSFQLIMGSKLSGFLCIHGYKFIVWWNYIHLLTGASLLALAKSKFISR